MPTLPTSAPARLFKALLVEDSSTQMGLMRALFQKRGHEVMEARNGAEALLLLAGEMPDVVVSDCYMPLIDGYQLCRLLKDDRATSHLPVLLLTAETRGLGHFWAKTCGADRFLVKDPDLEGVLEASEDLARSAPPQDPARATPFKNREDLGVDAIQRRLAHALEQRLLETTLRDSIARLYSEDPEAHSIIRGFVDLLQTAVLPGALAVVHRTEEGMVARGAHGRCVSEADRQELGRALERAMGLHEPLDLAWEPMVDPEERRLALRDPLQLVLPISVPGAPINAFMGLFVERRLYQEHVRLLEIASDELGRLLTLEASRQRLYHQAIQDPLTGLFNRRHTAELLQHEVLQSSRFSQHLAVMLIDLDHFKAINDRFGHAAGDRVLSMVAQRLAFGLRKVDRLGRMGGDEFLVICPQTDKEGAHHLAQRLLDTVTQTQLPNLPEGRPLSLSVGVASWRGDHEGDSVEALLARADQRLYKAKAEGRSRVVSED
ncbi:MAG TPA: diguanylate cyclase [Holophagaceae bacterium]|nr:diguanylate cyclase [Holophagaceae bacterium]